MSTPKPLTILVHPEIEGWSEFTELQAKGHRIVTAHDLKINSVTLEDVDLILGPQCWRMSSSLRRYLDLAILAARHERYPPKKIEVCL